MNITNLNCAKEVVYKFQKIIMLNMNINFPSSPFHFHCSRKTILFHEVSEKSCLNIRKILLKVSDIYFCDWNFNDRFPFNFWHHCPRMNKRGRHELCYEQSGFSLSSCPSKYQNQNAQKLESNYNCMLYAIISLLYDINFQRTKNILCSS